MYDYAFVHLKFTVPAAVLLTAIAYPILNRIHLIQTGFLVVVAFTAALPWDAYLIKHKVWSYPPEAIVGPRLLGIPFEELFFFVIQTYITALVYILFNKPVLHALHLNNQQNPPAWMRVVKVTGQVVLVALSVWGWNAAQVHQETSYLGLILVWACPFLLAIWTLAGRFILSLPWYATVLPMFLPTFYLWAVDEFALHRGTWSIGSGTKLDFCLFGKLDIEEATFFLVTNMLIVGGMAAFDQYLAVIYAFPTLFPKVNRYPTTHMLLQSRLINTSRYDLERIEGLREAVERLRLKSRSFYLANSLFSGRLRIDLILLYSFCRLADDLVDDAKSRREVLSWTAKLNHFLDLHYKDADATEDPKERRSESTPTSRQRSLPVPTKPSTSCPLTFFLPSLFTISSRVSRWTLNSPSTVLPTLRISNTPSPTTRTLRTTLSMSPVPSASSASPSSSTTACQTCRTLRSASSRPPRAGWASRCSTSTSLVTSSSTHVSGAFTCLPPGSRRKG
uniref:Bifunctional lycopene cyclase/phytoene synthase n=1 Tax=Neurospora crassa TaxID=5141 RepID=E7BAR7_NEUCS|nr:truncated phytoene synthase/carotene cyclase [Neurospora crassa]